MRHPQALNLHLLPCFQEIATCLAVVVRSKRQGVLKTEKTSSSHGARESWSQMESRGMSVSNGFSATIYGRRL